MHKYIQAEYNQHSANMNIEVYLKVNPSVRICVDISLLDLTFSCVPTRLGEKDSVS